MNTNRNTKSDKNMSGGNEIGDKNLQVLSSLKVASKLPSLP